MGELFAPWHLVVLFIFFSGFLLIVGAVIAMVRASGSAGQPSMSFRESVLSVVPRPAKILAASLLSIAVTVGVIAGSLEFLRSHNGSHAVVGVFAGLLGGTLVGCMFTIWVLALGYVYGDARQRNMPPVLWFLVAFFVPNLLGFLLYFVLRKPLGAPCPQCGQPITLEQRFCSWCGWQRYPVPSSPTIAPPGPTGLDPRATG